MVPLIINPNLSFHLLNWAWNLRPSQAFEEVAERSRLMVEDWSSHEPKRLDGGEFLCVVLLPKSPGQKISSLQIHPTKTWWNEHLQRCDLWLHWPSPQTEKSEFGKIWKVSKELELSGWDFSASARWPAWQATRCPSSSPSCWEAVGRGTQLLM